jgi:hypothetical protein
MATDICGACEQTALEHIKHSSGSGDQLHLPGIDGMRELCCGDSVGSDEAEGRGSRSNGEHGKEINRGPRGYEGLDLEVRWFPELASGLGEWGRVTFRDAAGKVVRVVEGQQLDRMLEEY